jgi:hypothetical protein
MTNADRKQAIRARMAATGEKYTVAMRAIEQARAAAVPDDDSAEDPDDDSAEDPDDDSAEDDGRVQAFIDEMRRQHGRDHGE